MPQQEPEKILVRISEVLEQLGIQYCITGGFAVAVWGRPRATADIDIIVELFPSHVEPLHAALRKISRAGYFDEDTVRKAILKKGEFNFIEPESGMKVDFWLRQQDEYGRNQLKRRRLELIFGKKMYFISAEDLIISKLRWYASSGSARQLEDVESILKISGEKLDMKYLKKWAAKFEVGEVLQSLSEDRCFCGSGKKYKKCHGM
ncbi:SEC-C domain-containing protein [Candidatus Peregrinibacteria bacterium]|nr:SEC-C domain-containing protein [Candidatus Peregrinibacteria bacterium]